MGTADNARFLKSIKIFRRSNYPFSKKADKSRFFNLQLTVPAKRSELKVRSFLFSP